MSRLICEICTVEEVAVHPNADRLSLARIRGWWVVIGKGQFKAGDKCIYIPIDSCLSNETEIKLFPSDSKIKLSKSRVRTIKIRGAFSQGLICSPELFGLENLPLGSDITDKLGIKKYEPPITGSSIFKGPQAPKRLCNPHFRKYTDISRLKDYIKGFQEGEPVVISEKLHGSSWRAGWFPNQANTLWKKIKKFFGRLPEWEYCYGSRNVQYQNKFLYDGFYKENIYAKMVKQYNLETITPKGYAVYGEVVGDGIQKNYKYGCSNGEHKLYVYDISVNGAWLNQAEFWETCTRLGLIPVPKLAEIPYNFEAVIELTKGKSTLSNEVREGVVVKPLIERTSIMGRLALKAINDQYSLNLSNSDFH